MGHRETAKQHALGSARSVAHRYTCLRPVFVQQSSFVLLPSTARFQTPSGKISFALSALAFTKQELRGGVRGGSDLAFSCASPSQRRFKIDV